VQGIKPDEERYRRWLEQSHSFIAALTPHLGYDAAAGLVKQATAEKRLLREVIIESGRLTAEDLELIFALGELTRPGIAGAKLLKKERMIKCEYKQFK